MFCGHCGKPIPEENASFCPHCGTAVLRPQQPESPTPQDAGSPQQGEPSTPKDANSTQQGEPSEQKKQPESLGHRIYRMLVGIAGLLICLSGFVIYVSKCLAAGSPVPSVSDLFFLFQVVFGLFLAILWVIP